MWSVLALLLLIVGAPIFFGLWLVAHLLKGVGVEPEELDESVPLGGYLGEI